MKLGQIDKLTTANIGKFHGGSATNIVADEVILEAEARSHNDESIHTQVQHMKETLRRQLKNSVEKHMLKSKRAIQDLKLKMMRM